jgi:hypothetical protein
MSSACLTAVTYGPWRGVHDRTEGTWENLMKLLRTTALTREGSYGYGPVLWLRFWDGLLRRLQIRLSPLSAMPTSGVIGEALKITPR